MPDISKSSLSSVVQILSLFFYESKKGGGTASAVGGTLIILFFRAFFNRLNAPFYIFVFASAHFLAVAPVVIKATYFLPAA